MALSVSLAETELTVDPGGFVRTEVRVRNTSGQPERVRIRVTGPAATWSWVAPPELDVAPGAEVVVSVGFKVQRTPEPAAGALAFEVVAGPAVGRDSESGAKEKVATTPEAKVPGVLTVSPFHDLAIEFDPPDARSMAPTEHNVVVENRGNVPVSTRLRATSEEDLQVDIGSATVETPPGQRVRVPVRLRPGKRPLLQGRLLPYALSVEPDAGDPVTLSGELDHPARFSPLAAGAAILAVVVLVFGIQLLSSDKSSNTDVAAGGPTSGSTVTAQAASSGAGTTTVALAEAHSTHGDCPAEAHTDTRATGLTPDQIRSLPSDFSFFQVASDDCLPVRWNPCEPIHFVINPANAPPTGVADAKEAFKRLAVAAGVTYVDDGLTDEEGVVNRAYQPERYGDRWAPILVHWMGNSRAQGDIQVVGGGLPAQVGDVYVTGNLFLNPSVVTNKETRTTVAGGFGGESVTLGRVGPAGVTWGRIILHELAHITGLGHSSQTGNLMYPETSDQTGPAAFSTDDLAGIRYLGKDAGCVQAPKAAPNLGRPAGSGPGSGSP